MIPSDPVMLLSYVNMKLRDRFDSLDALCEDEEIDKSELLAKMEKIGYAYSSEENRFK